MSALLLYWLICGLKSTSKMFALTLVVMLLSTLLNPIFSHNGATKLFYFNNYPVTMEAFVYGLFAGMMVCAGLLWGANWTKILRSDGVLYLFGKVAPKFATLINLTLGMIPKMRKQFKKVDENMFALGLYDKKKLFNLIKVKMKVFSITLTWAIENSVSTADNMQAKGYGLTGRKNFNLHKFDIYDVILLVLTLCFGILACVMLILNNATFYYYPTITFNFTGVDLAVYIPTVVFMNLPIICGIGENLKWRLSTLKN